MTSEETQDSEMLYTLVHGVTGNVENDVSLQAMPSVDALLELDELSLAELGNALKAGEIAEVVLLRPEDELNSSSLLDKAVLEDTKQALNERSGSQIMKDPCGPILPFAKGV